MNSNRIILTIWLVLLAFGTYSQCGPLSTPTVTNNGQSGIMFDIVALTNVEVTQFAMDFDNGTYDIEIYTIANTHVGNETNAGAWTLLGTAPGWTATGGTNVIIPITFNILLCPGESAGFYVTAAANCNYSNGTGVGNVAAADANIQILEGTGKAYPFSTNFTPRVPNVTVSYNCLSVCCTPPSLSTLPLTECEPSTVDLNNGISGTSGPGNATFYNNSTDAGNATNAISSIVGTTGTYHVRYESLSDPNCFVLGTIDVTINPLPDAGTNGTATYCDTDAASDLYGFLTGTPEPGGTWSPVLTSGTGVFDPTVDVAGTYTYSVTNSCGTVTADVVVTVNPSPDAGTNGSASYCPSEPAIDLYTLLGGSPELGGTWSPVMNSGTGVFDPGVDPAGTYTYTVTNGCGTATADVVVGISASPDAGLNGTTSYCPTDAASDLYGFLTGTPELGGTWSPALTSGTGVFDPSVDAAGTYTYTVSNGCGSSTADVVLIVNPSPNAGTNGAASFCPTEPPVDLYGYLGGSADVGGTWSPALTSGTGVFDPAVDPAGTYTYTVTNSCGTVTADVVVSINLSPDAGTNGATSYCPLDAASDLYSFLTGTPELGGTWSPALTSGTGVFDPSVDAAGTYTYTVTNGCGSATADVVVTINPLPDAGANGATSYCPTEPASDLYGFLTGAPELGGAWSPALTSGTGLFDPSVDAAGTYTYTVTNGCGSATADVVVTINLSPDAGMNGATSYCPADAASDLYGFLTGTPELGGTWSPALASGTGMFDPSVDAGGTYTYTVTNGCGSATADVVVTINPLPDAGANGTATYCPTDAASDLYGFLSGTPELGGSWSPALTSGTGVFDPSADAAGTYTYTVSNGCGSSSADVVVSMETMPVAGTNGTITLCSSDASVDLFGLLGGSPDLGGSWSPALTSGSGILDPSVDPGGIYTYTVSTSCGVASADIDVTVNIQEDATFSYSGQIFCSDANDPSPTITGTPGGTFSISAGGVIDPASGVIDISGSGPGAYQVTYSTGGPCPDESTTNVTIQEYPNIVITVIDSLCSTDSPFTLQAFPAGGVWSGNGVLPGTSTFDPSAAIGTNTLTYTIAGACGATETTTINVTQTPTITTIPDTTIQGGTSVVLTTTSSGSTLTWSPSSSLDCDDCLSPVATPEETTLYTVTASEDGCVSSALITVEVIYSPVVFVPNIFSPNADGNNDVLYVRGQGFRSMSFVVYDRWGEKVFESTDKNVGWDGTFRGKKMNPAVFVYYLKVVFDDNSEQELKGDVTLIR